MKITAVEIEKVLRGLEATIPCIEASSLGRQAEELLHPPAKGKWSAVDILAHLRACDDLWRHSIYAMLAQDHPILPDLDERRWAKATAPARLDFQRSFQILRLNRDELLQILRPLTLDEWVRSAEIGGRKHTVFSQARRLARHEAGHCQQIEDILDAQSGGGKE